MKRLLLGPAVLALPLALFGCNWGTKTPELPKVPEVIGSVSPSARTRLEEDFNHFPPVVPPAPVEAPVVRSASSAARHKPVKTHQPTKKHGPDTHRAARPLPAPRPPAAQAPVEESAPAVPPQQGVICIFPFSMIPSCTPGVP